MIYYMAMPAEVTYPWRIPERRIVHPDTANGAMWFVGPDTHPSRHPIARQFDRFMKTERPIQFQSRISPEIIGEDTSVTYLYDSQEPAGHYYYLSMVYAPQLGAQLEKVEFDAAHVMYKTFSRFHPVLVTGAGIYWIDGISGGVHFGVELPREDSRSTQPNVVFSKGIKEDNSFTKRIGTVGDYRVDMSITFNPDILSSTHALQRFLNAPYNFTESRKAISPRFIVS